MWITIQPLKIFWKRWTPLAMKLMHWRQLEVMLKVTALNLYRWTYCLSLSSKRNFGWCWGHCISLCWSRSHGYGENKQNATQSQLIQENIWYWRDCILKMGFSVEKYPTINPEIIQQLNLCKDFAKQSSSMVDSCCIVIKKVWIRSSCGNLQSCPTIYKHNDKCPHTPFWFL